MLNSQRESSLPQCTQPEGLTDRDPLFSTSNKSPVNSLTQRQSTTSSPSSKPPKATPPVDDSVPIIKKKELPLPSGPKNKRRVTRGLAGCLIGVTLWQLKTLLVKLIERNKGFCRDHERVDECYSRKKLLPLSYHRNVENNKNIVENITDVEGEKIASDEIFTRLAGSNNTERYMDLKTLMKFVEDDKMVVDEMNILTATFLRYDGEKIYYPNSVLAVKPVSNLYRSPPMSECLEFAISLRTSMKIINDLQEKIKKYLESNPWRWQAEHSVQFMEIEDVNKMKVAFMLIIP
ncbi:hypothetical protein GH714_026791 [Hevea brasiliensis]|uniref:Uncharacterized protein n=1 Tax=Hevea brasiliensis TaxID=3981 RepID=A0A6A6LV96_HEVBR|nr:hypothetical protein GH714_026791 [Hevea brasiliensis]